MGEIGYKGFEKGLVCRGKQYAENTVFEEPEARICHKGMHYCKNPFDVLDFYDLVNSDGSVNEFATVEPLADEKTNDGKKFCTRKLKIGAKLGIPGFVKVCVDYLNEKTSLSDEEVTDNDNGKREEQMASSGDYAQMASSGYYAQMASSGYSAKMASSGDHAQMASSGYSAKMASSGDSAKMASSGYSAKMASSGNSAQMVSTGEYAVVMCAGHDSKAKAKKGSFITLSEWKYDEEIEKWIPVNVKTRKVDGKHIKADTFYKLQDGKFVEVGDE